MLVFLVWFAGFVEVAKFISFLLLLATCLLFFIALLIAAIYISEDDPNHWLNGGGVRIKNLFVKYYKKGIAFIFMFGLAFAIIPSQKTYYAMLGVYAGQEIIANLKAQALFDKSIKAIEVQLDSVINKNQEK